MSVEENHTGTNEQIKPFLRFPVWQKSRTGATVITSKVDLPRLQNRTFQFHSANHSDKPLKAKIVSAMASTIFESYLHCLEWNWNVLFCSLGTLTLQVTQKNTRKPQKSTQNVVY